MAKREKATVSQAYLSDGEGGTLEPPKPPNDICSLVDRMVENREKRRKLTTSLAEDADTLHDRLEQWMESENMPKTSSLTFSTGNRIAKVQLTNKAGVSIQLETPPGEDE